MWPDSEQSAVHTPFPALTSCLFPSLGQVTALLPLLSLGYMVLNRNRHALGPAWAALLKATGADEAAFGRSITQARTHSVPATVADGGGRLEEVGGGWEV